MVTVSTDSKAHRIRAVYRTSAIQPQQYGEASVHDRQALIFDQKKVSTTRIGLIGAGGNSITAWQLCRLGVGKIVICDRDTVELSNLNRQMFYPKDIYQNKAIMLGENLKKESTGNTLIETYALNFQQVIQRYPQAYKDIDVALALVDNDLTRYDVSRYFLENKIPVLICGVTKDCTSGYVFFQEPNSACFGCAFPEPSKDAHPCGRNPAAIYIHSIVTGIAVFAIAQTIFQKKKLSWHIYRIFLNGGDVIAANPPINPKCSICKGKQRKEVKK